MEPHWEEKACPDCPMTNIQPEVGLERLVDLSTISNRSTHYRLSWTERLARNARGHSAPGMAITLFRVPLATARVLGLKTA